MAELFYKEYALRIENLYGEKHLATSDCYNLIAAFYTHVGDFRAALEYCGKALVIRLAVLGLSHQCTADSHYNIGLLYRLNGDPFEAIREFGYARRIRTDVFGEQSLGVAEVDISLGFTLHQLHHLVDAESAYASAYRARLLRLGGAHEDTLEAFSLLNAVRTQLGKGEYMLEHIDRRANNVSRQPIMRTYFPDPGFVKAKGLGISKSVAKQKSALDGTGLGGNEANGNGSNFGSGSGGGSSGDGAGGGSGIGGGTGGGTGDGVESGVRGGIGMSTLGAGGTSAGIGLRPGRGLGLGLGLGAGLGSGNGSDSRGVGNGVGGISGDSPGANVGQCLTVNLKVTC